MQLATGSITSDGYEVVHGVFTPFELKGVLSQSREFPRSRAGMRHLMSFSAVSQIANNARMIGLAQLAIGTGATPFKATLFDKSSDANWLVVWHQDTALPLVERHAEGGWGPWSEKDGVIYAHAPASALQGIVALRVALDDSTEENGPLRVLPGTHRLGLLTDDEIAQEVNRHGAVSCTVACGGVISMRPLTVHASSKSKCSQPRRVLHIEYASRELRDRVNLAIA